MNRHMLPGDIHFLSRHPVEAVRRGALLKLFPVDLTFSIVVSVVARTLVGGGVGVVRCGGRLELDERNGRYRIDR